ncbi:MAG TPA: dephospho-CoA kinase [Vicinamibacterales bacterium]|jgi:dephospho-CoA kinase
MRRVALTGGIATGKSHVLAQLAKLGAPTIDADKLARDVVAPGTPGLKAVVDRFGEDVLDQMGGLDRRKLGSIVFSDPVARRDLEEIIHPAVRGAIDEWYASLGEVPAGFAVADIPLLYETARQREFDAVIVTACDTNTQLTRIMARDGISEAEARARIAAQLPMSEKIRRADYVINTDGSFDETSVQVRDVFKRLSAP